MNAVLNSQKPACPIAKVRLSLSDSLRPSAKAGVWVNDVHSQLTPTRVRAVLTPATQAELAAAIRHSARQQLPIAVSGCRHSMGGQPFATNGMCIDTRALQRIISFDRERGLIEVEAGIQWPELIDGYLGQQVGSAHQWGIAQKQTGADNFTLGGSLASNIHGRGLAMKPLVSNVESFKLINGEGEVLRCSRQENRELFSLAIGGYGLFGVITSVTLRLVPRRRLKRVVEVIRSEELLPKLNGRIRDGCLYGDFQFSIDENSCDFMKIGVFSCYQPVDGHAPECDERKLSGDQWLRLLHLAHTDRAAGFDLYAKYYLSTNGQTYWSDTHQLSPYLSDYADKLRPMLGGGTRSSLILTEVYVPRPALGEFLRQAADMLRADGPPVIYGTVRLIEKDGESFLAWAKEPYACIIFNLLTFHSAKGMAASASALRRLIDIAITLGGSHYLTYHRFTTREQVEACYPQFEQFLALKQQYDPGERFQSDWYRHYRDAFAGVVG